MALTETQKVLVLAGLSGVDPRTVKKHLRGEAVRESVRERIDLALRHLAQVQGAPMPQLQG
ncbi:hypothetical protein [Sorangium sp. So ce128]|uniref:hypothetical protein n=1 Tax=Sorangium sp. So ce128 TaxID=3133281 RepID=UPI003F06EB03